MRTVERQNFLNIKDRAEGGLAILNFDLNRQREGERIGGSVQCALAAGRDLTIEIEERGSST